MRGGTPKNSVWWGGIWKNFSPLTNMPSTQFPPPHNECIMNAAATIDFYIKFMLFVVRSKDLKSYKANRMMNILVCVLWAQYDMEGVYYEHNTTWKVLCTVFTHSFFVSEISLLRFQKRVLNFRTQARSINESIHLYTVEFIGDKLHKNITTYTTFFNLC